MAGSDLDGDEYFVTWHPDLIFKGKNATPMDFPSVKKDELDRPIEVPDMIEFIVNSICNNKVGSVSHAHLAWADQEGVYSPICEKIAGIFSHVIDFNKTGYLPPEVQGKNILQLLPPSYPDFMCKHEHKETYWSKQVLGKLFRISERVEQAVSTIDKEDSDRIGSRSNWEMDERFLISGHEKFLSSAADLYKIYSSYLDAEQDRYNIESEEAMVSGCVTKIKGMYDASEDLYDINRRLGEKMGDVLKFTREKFDEIIEEKKSKNDNTSTLKMQFAAACYVFTYRDHCEHRSFPWVFAEHLHNILVLSKKPMLDSAMEKLSKSIEAIDMRAVNLAFKQQRVSWFKPLNDNVAKVCYVLMNWGQKSKFLPAEHSKHYQTLSVPLFMNILELAQRQNFDVFRSSSPGKNLVTFLRAITNLPDDQRIGDWNIPGQAAVHMKRQLLLAHHHLARDPNIDCLMIHKESTISRSIHVGRNRWWEIESQDWNELRRLIRERYRVNVWFSRLPLGRGGKVQIKGFEQNVLEFEEMWTGEPEPQDDGLVNQDLKMMKTLRVS